MKTFGDKLKAARQRLGLTQEQAARQLNTSHATWCRWEQNVCEPRNFDTLRRIAKLLGVKPGDLL